jgi:hypothetical protein
VHTGNLTRNPACSIGAPACPARAGCGYALDATDVRIYAVGLFAGSACTLVVAAALLLETSGRDLHALAEAWTWQYLCIL